MAKHSLDGTLTNLRVLLAPEAPAQVTDADLLTRYVASRDETAFASLIRRHGNMVLSVCRRVLRNPHDVEDAFQATFLTLVQKAAAIRKRNAVGSWLHGTAFRIASDLRIRLARRQAAPLLADVQASPGEDAKAQAWHEILAALDEELARLPERYRAPLILCYLEGRTRDEAALQLGWSVGTVRGRLERGRQRLHTRLRRRGIALPAALLATGLTEVAASAAPAYLIVSTVNAALKIQSGVGLAACGLSEPVIELLNQGSLAMFGTKKKLLVLTLLAVGLFGGAALYRQVNYSSPEAAWAEDQPLQALPAEAKVELSGKVVDPEGKPAAGARVAVFTFERSSFGDGTLRTTTAADGSFKLSVPRAELALHLGARGAWTALAATADGHGLTWRSASAFLPKEEQKGIQLFFNLFRTGNEPVLQLVPDDAPLSGQIKTKDGRPAVGVRVELQSLWTNDKSDLGPWLAAVGRDETFGEATWGKLDRFLAGPGMARFAATSDAEGRFRLAGIGRGRLAALLVRGPNAGCTTVLARTAAGEKISVNGLSSLLSPNPQGCFGTEIALTVPPSRPIEGMVKDVESGKPVAGAVVQSHRFAGLNALTLDYLSAQTDSAGLFRLEGMPIGRDNLLLVRFPADQPYLPAVVEVDSSAGKGPIKTEIKVRKGVWVEGQVTDAKTGRPLAATIDVYSPQNNPNLAKYPDYKMILSGKLYRTDSSGRFRVPAIAGRAVIAARLRGTGPEFGERDTTQAGKAYRPLSSDFEIDGLSDDEPLRQFYTKVEPCFLEPRTYHQIRSLDIPATAKSVQCDLKVD